MEKLQISVIRYLTHIECWDKNQGLQLAMAVVAGSPAACQCPQGTKATGSAGKSTGKLASLAFVSTVGGPSRSCRRGCC